MSEVSAEDLRRLEKMSSAIAAEEQRKRRVMEGTQCFACFLDLDGFKHRVMEHPDELYAAYRRQREYLLSSFFRADAYVHGESDVQLLHFDRLLWPYMFSDSWFFASSDSTPESLRQISAVAAGIMMRCLEIGFPARGGIGAGMLWWNPEAQIILGPAIVNAHQVAESLDCFGVAIHPDLSGRAGDGAFTAPISAAIKQGKKCQVPHYEERRFACLGSDKRSGRWHAEGWLQRYDELARSYEAQSEAKPHVVRRYRESRKILEHMLQGEPACS